MGSEADSRAGDPCSFPRRGDPQISYCVASLKKQRGRNRRTNFVIWVAGKTLFWSLARCQKCSGVWECVGFVVAGW